MPDKPATYVFSIQLEHFHRSLRFHWVICSTQNPDRLVSWGHAPSRELAEAAVQDEMENLRSGRTLGGREQGTKRPMLRLSMR
jgi:hypothetical protein